MKTPTLAPAIEDKALRTYCQFLRDDLAALEARVNSQKFDQVNFIVTSGKEFNIGREAVGGIVISSDGVSLSAISLRNSLNGCQMTVYNNDNAIGINLVVLRVLK